MPSYDNIHNIFVVLLKCLFRMGRKKTLASKSQAYTRWSLTPLHTEVAELAASHIEKAEIQIDKFASESDIKGKKVEALPVQATTAPSKQQTEKVAKPVVHTDEEDTQEPPMPPLPRVEETNQPAITSFFTKMAAK